MCKNKKSINQINIYCHFGCTYKSSAEKQKKKYKYKSVFINIKTTFANVCNN